MPLTKQEEGYDVSSLKPGIVHLGAGKFAAAFLGEFCHDLAQNGHQDWGVIGVKPRSSEVCPPGRDGDYRYIHVKAGKDSAFKKTLNPFIDIIPGKDNSVAVISHLSDPSTKLITLSVTAEGYGLNGYGRSDANQVRSEALAIKERRWGDVSTVPGWLTACLEICCKDGRVPPTILSMDNLPRNGAVTKRAVLEIANLVAKYGGNEELCAYIEEKGAFPNSMVDRIVPAYDPATHDKIIGQNNPYPVILSEEHRSLVIEDKFNPGTMPPWDRVCDAVTIVDDTKAYEDLKLCAVNGGHLAMALVAKALDIEYVHEAVNPVKNSNLRQYVRAFMEQSIASLDGVDALFKHDFVETTLARFDNALLPDKIDRLLSNTASKVFPRLFNFAAFEKNSEMEASAFAIATWLSYMGGKSETGRYYALKGSDKGFSVPETPMELARFLARGNTSLNKDDLLSFSNRVFDIHDDIEWMGIRRALAERADHLGVNADTQYIADTPELYM